MLILLSFNEDSDRGRVDLDQYFGSLEGSIFKKDLKYGSAVWSSFGLCGLSCRLAIAMSRGR